MNIIVSIYDSFTRKPVANFSDDNEVALILSIWQDPKSASFIRSMTEKKIAALRSEDQKAWDEIWKDEEQFLSDLG